MLMEQCTALAEALNANRIAEEEDAAKKLTSGVNRDLNARKVEAKDVKNVEGNEN